nr:reverse transcriptase domain-containing protein [Tanacetum cinerariifolium]
MSAMANTTPIVTTVTKPATNPRDADYPRVNIQDFCEEYYEDILPIIMDKVRRDKRKEAHARLDFGEGSKERRTREDSHHSSHRRQSAFDRLSETYSPSTTKSRPGWTNSRDHPRSRSRPRRLDASNEDCPEDRERFCGVGKSYDDSYSHSYHDRDRSHHMKMRKDNESLLSGVLKSDSSDERSMKGAPECMRIFEFMHGINNPKLTKRLNEHVPKTMEEMMITTTAFIQREVVAASKKKGHTSWRTHDKSKRQTSENRSDFRGHPIEGRGSSRFTPLQGRQKKFLRPRQVSSNPSPPMVTPVEKRSSNKFCDFHNDKGHSTDECMQLKKQIEELVRAGKLLKQIKEIKHGRDQSKARKKETPAKDKPVAIYMIQSLRPEVKNQMVLATTSLTGFSGKTIWPLGQLRLLVTIGDVDHSTRAWMNFMIVTSLSPYNGIFGRPGIKEIQAVPSTAHGMLKFPVGEGIVTIRSTILIHVECATVITSSAEVAIGGTLLAKGRTELCSILRENLDIFAWKPSNMIGVPRSVAEHRLNIREGNSLVRQKKRGQALERAKAIQAEVQKILEAGIMREVYDHDWLSNPVMVKKHDDSWRMCVDFTDLNKVCPQVCYPLPKINWKVESLCGYPFKCFLDAYKGYHQIQLAESDEEKMAFHTGQGVYCYTKMSFGFKNAGATYQRLVNKAFDSQIGRNIEVYIDDLVVKSHTEAKMLSDIGIKPYPNKTTAVLQLPSPRTIKEVQSLNGKLASLNRFLSKSVKKSLPLFKTLKKCIKKSDLHWTSEAEQAFKQLKQHFSELPLLVAPKPKEELIVYISASYGAISAVLITESGATQMPPRDFGSASYHGYYRPIHKTNYVSSRRGRTTTKIDRHARRTQYHVPAKDVSEKTSPSDFLTEMPDESPPATPVVETQQVSWTLFTNGLSCVDGSSVGLILTSPEGTEFTNAPRFQFTASNNKAEYEALIASLRIAVQMGVQNEHVCVDSKLVANQVLGTYVAKEENMIKYLEKFKSLVLVEILKEKSIKEKEVTNVVEEDGPTWMTPIMEYLKEGTLSSDRKEARKLHIKA